MAFGGIPGTAQAIGPNTHKVGALTLAANVGPPDPSGVAVDTGLVVSDLTTTPLNAVTVPTTFGPGEGNWSQADVDAVTVTLSDISPAPTNYSYSKLLVSGNLHVIVHSRAALPIIGLEVALDAQHTGKR